jgi:hypothetical protein
VDDAVVTAAREVERQARRAKAGDATIDDVLRALRGLHDYITSRQCGWDFRFVDKDGHEWESSVDRTEQALRAAWRDYRARRRRAADLWAALDQAQRDMSELTGTGREEAVA